MIFGQAVNPMLEACANPANGARVGIDGLGLQAFELQVLEVRLLLPVKVIGGNGRHAGLSSRNIAESTPQLRWEEGAEYSVRLSQSTSPRSSFVQPP